MTKTCLHAGNAPLLLEKLNSVPIFDHAVGEGLCQTARNTHCHSLRAQQANCRHPLFTRIPVRNLKLARRSDR